VTLTATNAASPLLLDPLLESSVWTQVLTAPAATPPARDSHALVYDSARSKVVLFGGEQCAGIDCATVTQLNDTWTFAGSGWVQVPTTTRPSERYSHAMAFDDAQRVALLFGGYRCSDSACAMGASLADTWRWDGSNWQQLTPTSAPGRRDSHSMVYDSARKVMVLFGGENSRRDLGDHWEWNGATGAWAQRTFSKLPSPRQSHGMAFDSKRKVTVLFGGYSCATTACSPQLELGDTWEYDGISWTQRMPATSPTARDSFAIFYDIARGKTVLFGGAGGSETWEWDGTNWAQRIETKVPAVRNYSALAFDVSRGRAVLFGGSDILGKGLGDTWESFVRGGSCTSGASCNSGFCVDGVCCDTAACGTCQACNTEASPGICAPLLNAPDPPTCSAPNTCDAKGQCKVAIAQACPNGNADCATGACANGICCDRACTGACEACTKAFGATADGTCGPAKAGYPGSPACSGKQTCDGTQTTCASGGGGGAIVCDGKHSLTGADGQQTNCAPYGCDVSGCLAVCTTASDCASPAVCNAARQCIDPKAPSASDSAAGDGCALRADAEPLYVNLLRTIMVLSFLRRRKARR
jgi:hypothetical protein